MAYPDWGRYRDAIERWERILGRPAPAPHNKTGKLSARFAEWMIGLEDGWVTGVPGLPNNAMFKALGNAVVPLQAVFALRVLLAWLPPDA